MIEYIHEPDDLQCGQAVLAMLTGMTAEEAAEILGNYRETNLREMREFIDSHGYTMGRIRCEAKNRKELPPLCLLSLETPRCWHWSLYCEGIFYDPEHGVMDDFPECRRKYYWKIDKNEQ